MRLPRLRSALAAAALCLAACRDDPASIDPPAPRHPLAGTYDFTARFTQFTFETAAPSPPDCPDYTQYCTHSRAPGAGSLAGVLVVVDSAVALTRTQDELPVRGTFTGRFCAQVDLAATNGCVREGSTATYAYQRGRLWVAAPFVATSGSLGVIDGPDATEGHIRLMDARFDADSLYGTVVWRLTPGRSPPSYWGTFVARRRGAASSR